MKKRILAAILAALMILPAASCATDGDNPATTTAPNQTAAVTEAETAFFPAIEKKDYKDATFRIIACASEGSWYYAEEYKNESGNTGVLNNTIYEMNTLVEEHLGVELAFEYGGTTIYNTVSTTMMAGDDTYQLCGNHAYYDTPNFITSRSALDFYELESLDLDRPYWNAEAMEQMSINGRAYVGFGALASHCNYVFYCNKDMLEDVGMTVPYDDVRNGTWTFDKFASMTTGLYRDNGDGQRNNLDIFGFAASWDGLGTRMLHSADIFVLNKNSDDEFELALYSDRLVEMYDQLYSWSKDESTQIWEYAAPEEKIVDFTAGQAYFTGGSLGTQYLDTDLRVGILPLPKYDVAQENYCNLSHGNNLVIPTTVRNLDMVSDVLELMAFYSGTMVLEKYYDEVLQLRVSEAPDDRDMVVLVYDTVVYDPAIILCNGNAQLWNLVHTTYGCVLGGNASVTSYYQSNAKGAEKWLSNLMKKLSR